MRISLKRVGAIWHWRLGRIGGSFYISKKKPQRERVQRELVNTSRFDLRLARIRGEH